MNENDAKNKWCPMVRMDTGESGSYNAFNINSDGTQINDGHCIGSDCMMWRTLRVFKETEDGGQWETTGYCGLGGKP